MHRDEKLAVTYAPITSLTPHPGNARTHSKRQIRQIAESIKKFGFLNAILLDLMGRIIAGHGRWLAAQLLGMTMVPVVRVGHLTANQIRAYVITDNRLAELAGWDKEILEFEFDHLTTCDLDFDVTITGFEVAEIDALILNDKADTEDDQIPIDPGLPAVSKVGDAWNLGEHKLHCSDSLSSRTYAELMGGKRAAMACTDPPYNQKIEGHVSGRGRVHHREFAMACGELSDSEFDAFVDRLFRHLCANSVDGSLHHIFMDWPHAHTVLDAGRSNYSELKNICVWVKQNAGLGSFYRSQHELIFVFKNGTAAHRNNIQLGRFGRNRSNVWNYASPSAFGRAGEEGRLSALHPTVKPVDLIADAILDCTTPGDIVLDAFLGSGTTLIAAERTRRICYGIEIDPLYVDVAIRRWQRHTGEHARHAKTGITFNESAAEASPV